MLTSADKVGGWGQKGTKHADVILEWSLMAMIDNIDSPNGIKQKYVVPHGCMSWPRPPFLPHRHQSDHLIFARVRDKSRVSKQMHVNLTKELERKRGNVKDLRIVWSDSNSVNDSYA